MKFKPLRHPKSESARVAAWEAKKRAKGFVILKSWVTPEEKAMISGFIASIRAKAA